MARRKFSVSVCVFLLVPVVIPALFVLLVSPTADQAGAEELGPKQGYLSGEHSAEPPRSSSNKAAANQVAKPSGKMGFVPASPTPRDGSTSAPRPVVNPVARRSVPQPPKYNVFAGTAPEPPKTQNTENRAVVSRPNMPQTPQRSRSQTNSDARIPSLPVPVEPQAELVQTERPQAEPPQSEPQQPTVEKVESPFKTLEPRIATSRPAPVQMLEEPKMEEPVFDEPALADRPSRGVVKLFFDDEPADGEPDENMDLGTPIVPASPTNEIRPVAAQGEPARAENENAAEELPRTRQELLAEVLEDLKPVRQIDLRNAVRLPDLPAPADPTKKKTRKKVEPNELTALAMQLPDLSEDESKNVHKPNDIAFTMWRHHKPSDVVPIAHTPWQANRDSYPFLHKPLWYEDPNLERCGRGWGPLTTTVSAVHFAANTAILPYRFTAEKQWRCVRTLPDCTVCEKFGCEAYLPPWSWSGAAAQAAATVGIIYLVP